MPYFDYKVYDSKGNFVCEREELFRSYKDAKECLEFISDEGEIFFGYKQTPLIAKTQGHWNSVPTWEPGLGCYVNNSKHRDQIAQAKGLVAQDDVSSNKHLHNDLMEKKMAYNAYWDKRHEDFHNLVDSEMKKGFSRERAELNASQEWLTDDKLEADQRHYKPEVASKKAPTNLTIK